MNLGGIKCIKNVTIHTSSILSINVGEHWLGIGAADNSMSLFHRPQERLGGLPNSSSRMAGWQLYRTPQKTVAMVRFFLYFLYYLCSEALAIPNFMNKISCLLFSKRETYCFRNEVHVDLHVFDFITMPWVMYDSYVIIIDS